ncbi:hypothetical protein [Eikenella corrodens]|uniref:hypothetical protein n=1 Tax=Eikenella corrodens TaxID=539 RepID=UPI0007D06EC6|nr:hypothetical protein [Eikenella corrodens]OAM29744.1 hypothetical protein A7P93_06760 [Eikenella corrodens]
MIKQFEINNYVRKQLQDYLTEKKLTLEQAMAEETSNNEIAAIVHAGLPSMVRRIYSLGKMQTFFWEKRELIQGFIADRLQGGDDSKKAKKAK